MIEAGNYRARCTGEQDVQFGLSRSGGEQIAITFDLLDGEGRATGQQITYFGSFVGGALKHTKDALRNCGWQGDSLMDLTGIDSCEVELRVVHKEFEGVPRAEVSFVNKPGGGSGAVKFKNAMTDEQRAAFAARMRGAFMGDAAPGAKKADNLPF